MVMLGRRRRVGITAGDLPEMKLVYNIGVVLLFGLPAVVIGWIACNEVGTEQDVGDVLSIELRNSVSAYRSTPSLDPY